MFEAFGESVRRVLEAARHEAEVRRHRHLGTEHVLLGLLDEQDNVVLAALAHAGTDADLVRATVSDLVPAGRREPRSPLEFTPNARHAIEAGLRVATRNGHNGVTPAHLLAGLLEARESTALLALHRAGADLDDLRAVLSATEGVGTEPVGEELGPSCPSCHAHLDDLRTTSVLLGARSVALVWCGRCGGAVGVLPA